MNIITGQDELIGKWMCRNGGRWAGGPVIGQVNSMHEIVAGVSYYEFNGRHAFMSVSSDGSGHWLTRRFLWAVFHYPFMVLGLQRVSILVDATNERSRRFVEHVGFRFMTRLSDASEGGDMLLFSMHRTECDYVKDAKYVIQ